MWMPLDAEHSADTCSTVSEPRIFLARTWRHLSHDLSKCAEAIDDQSLVIRRLLRGLHLALAAHLCSVLALALRPVSRCTTWSSEVLRWLQPRRPLGTVVSTECPIGGDDTCKRVSAQASTRWTSRPCLRAPSIRARAFSAASGSRSFGCMPACAGALSGDGAFILLGFSGTCALEVVSDLGLQNVRSACRKIAWNAVSHHYHSGGPVKPPSPWLRLLCRTFFASFACRRVMNALKVHDIASPPECPHNLKRELVAGFPTVPPRLPQVLRAPAF